VQRYQLPGFLNDVRPSEVLRNSRLIEHARWLFKTIMHASAGPEKVGIVLENTSQGGFACIYTRMPSPHGNAALGWLHKLPQTSLYGQFG
jgi:hypothetical protein